MKNTDFNYVRNYGKGSNKVVIPKLLTTGKATMSVTEELKAMGVTDVTPELREAAIGRMRSRVANAAGFRTHGRDKTVIATEVVERGGRTMLDFTLVGPVMPKLSRIANRVLADVAEGKAELHEFAAPLLDAAAEAAA